MQCPQRVTAVFGWLKHKNEIIHSLIYHICAGWVLTLCYLGRGIVLIKGLCLPTGSFHSMGQQRPEQVSMWSLASVLSVRCAGGSGTCNCFNSMQPSPFASMRMFSVERQNHS